MENADVDVLEHWSLSSTLLATHDKTLEGEEDYLSHSAHSAKQDGVAQEVRQLSCCYLYSLPP